MMAGLHLSAIAKRRFTQRFGWLNARIERRRQRALARLKSEPAAASGTVTCEQAVNYYFPAATGRCSQRADYAVVIPRQRPAVTGTQTFPPMRQHMPLGFVCHQHLNQVITEAALIARLDGDNPDRLLELANAYQAKGNLLTSATSATSRRNHAYALNERRQGVIAQLFARMGE